MNDLQKKKIKFPTPPRNYTKQQEFKKITSKEKLHKKFLDSLCRLTTVRRCACPKENQYQVFQIKNVKQKPFCRTMCKLREILRCHWSKEAWAEAYKRNVDSYVDDNVIVY